MTAKELADAVIAAVRRATAPLTLRLEAMERRLSELPAPERGEKGDTGDRGERGEKGDDGEDGIDGRDGDKGERGPKGDSVGLGEVIHALQPQVKLFLEALPMPAPPPIEQVAAALLPSLEVVHARWALEWERRAADMLQKAVDRMPAPADGKDGRDGADALALSDFTAEVSENGRTVILSLAAGEQRKEARLHFPVMLDRGVFKEGAAYLQGDAVTWAGSIWVAQKDSPEGKPEASRDWRLGVKRGRDGKDGVVRTIAQPSTVKASP